MGGDVGLDVTVPAAVLALGRHPDIEVFLVGDKPSIERKLRALRNRYQERITVIHTTEVVGMGEAPAKALRFKKDSSMRVAIDLVKEKKAVACVSAGNTGALMATAKFVLKTIPGISRPAIISRIPNLNQTGSSFMLDLGANLDCTGAHLYQFAVMGSVLASAVYGIPRPRVGLINVGEEQIKGNEPVKEANALLNDTPEINYVGFIEGNDIFSGKVDVAVCDGFIGNVALKSIEGLVRTTVVLVKKEITRNIFNMCIGLLMRLALRPLVKKLDPKLHNGASLIGLNGIVIKSHGSAGVEAFANAISIAVNEAELDVLSQIQNQVSSLVKEHE